jgi:hypothetical protein
LRFLLFFLQKTKRKQKQKKTNTPPKGKPKTRTSEKRLSTVPQDDSCSLSLMRPGAI